VTKKKVYVVGGDYAIEQMFEREGWEAVDVFDWIGGETVDLVQFTGGADVSPFLYGEEKGPNTYTNEARDMQEKNVYLKAVTRGIPMAGICRGGQFLNVMNGGKMWQHIPDSSHCRGNHSMHLTPTAIRVLDLDSAVFEVTSTHHQMIIPTDDAVLLGMAFECRANSEHPLGYDVEAVVYPKTKALCFQPHPEYVRERNDFVDLYFRLVDHLISGKAWS
jgi:gamma-glutamyl-gamma-aminobutyrate hydrolase PuuD